MNQSIAIPYIPVSASELDKVNQPIHQASGMPNSAYTDHSCFEFERDRIFAKNWVAVGFVSDFADAMVRPVDFMGIPILISKTKRGVIKVFHNVCSHRGMKLVEQERETNGLIICPYHSWTYDVEGELKATPNIGGVGVHKVDGFSCEGRGLKQIPSHIWLGILFVNLDGQAGDFQSNAAAMISRAESLMGETGESLMKSPDTDNGLTLELQCNWKLAVENYLEAYHLPYIHPGLNSYSPLNKHHCEIHDERSSGQITTTFDPGLDSENPLPLFPDWDLDRLGNGDYPALYPNLLLGFQANHLFAMILHPLSADRCKEEVALFYVGEAANDPVYQQIRRSNLETWAAVFNEDVGPCERMQIGRQSPGYTGGAFSPEFDQCSHHFHRWIAKQYEQALME